MKRVVLVTAHFPPSNLSGVHRARIWGTYLPEFGWHPIVLTSHWKYYEERLDWGLEKLVDPNLEIVRTKALNTKPVRLLGNMALRAMWWSRRTLDDILSNQSVQFVHIILPDHFSALLGPRVRTKHGVNYGIDFMDPWVKDRPASKKLLSKAWVACCLSYLCEPWSVRYAGLITGVSPLSYAGVFERNPSLSGSVVTAPIPMANSEDDYNAILNGYAPETRYFDASDGRFHMVYAGTLWPAALEVVDRLLRAIRRLVDETEFGRRLRVTFIGTGRSPDDPYGHNLTDRIRRYNLTEFVTEHPMRIPYLDVLWHLKAASGILIVGSTDPHYTPSKVFQAVQSGNPVMAMLHRDSTAAPLLSESKAGFVVDVPDDGLVNIDELKSALTSIMHTSPGRSTASMSAFERLSARAGTKQLADAMDMACAG